jgi:hypothetical protein
VLSLIRGSKRAEGEARMVVTEYGVWRLDWEMFFKGYKISIRKEE